MFKLAHLDISINFNFNGFQLLIKFSNQVLLVSFKSGIFFWGYGEFQIEQEWGKQDNMESYFDMKIDLIASCHYAYLVQPSGIYFGTLKTSENVFQL